MRRAGYVSLAQFGIWVVGEKCGRRELGRRLGRLPGVARRLWALLGVSWSL